MPENVVERAVIPRNPSAARVINQDRYNLFVPIARRGVPGITAYDPEDFVLTDQVVSINPVIHTIIEEAYLSTLDHEERLVALEDDVLTLNENYEQLVSDVSDLDFSVDEFIAQTEEDLNKITVEIGKRVEIDESGKSIVYATPMNLEVSPDGSVIGGIPQYVPPDYGETGSPLGTILVNNPVHPSHPVNLRYFNEQLSRLEFGSYIEVEVDENYEIILRLRNASGIVISTASIDLPIEMAFTDAKLSDDGTEMIFTLQNDKTVSVKLGKFLGGLVDEDTFTVEMSKKVDRTEEALKVYGTKGRGPDGNIIQEPYSVDIVAKAAGTILQTSLPDNTSFDTRIPTATFAVCNPQKPYQPATKQYVDDGLGGKVDKIEKTGDYAYVTNTNGYLAISASNYGGYIATYGNANSGKEDKGGFLATSTPQNPYQAANKQYVDDVAAGRVPITEYTYKLYGTRGVNPETGKTNQSYFSMSGVGMTTGDIVNWQAATAAIFDGKEPTCTLGVADPIKPIQVANKRYVESITTPLQRDVRALNEAALGILYTFEVFTFTQTFSDIPNGALAHANIKYIGAVQLYLLDTNSDLTNVGIGKLKTIDFLDADGMKISDFTPVEGGYFEIPEGAVQMILTEGDAEYYDGYNAHNYATFDFVAEMQVKVGA